MPKGLEKGDAALFYCYMVLERRFGMPESLRKGVVPGMWFL